MDADRKRELKQRGKAEVARRSSELRAELSAANPAPIGSDDWAKNYRTGTEREKWLRKKLPILHRDRLNSLFVVRTDVGAGWMPHLGGYLLCNICGSAVPSAIRNRLFYWSDCACRNMKWRCILGRCKSTIRDEQALVPIKLIGRG